MVRTVISLTAIFAAALWTGSARAENVFIASDTTIAGTVTDTNYIVGKDDSVNFQTLPGSVILSVTGDIYPDTTNWLFGPSGFMYGVNVFGGHRSNISGSTQGLFGHDSSDNNLSGFTQNYGGYDNASLTIDSGTSNNTRGFQNSITTLNSGQINYWSAYQNATLNVAGGTVSNAILNDTSILNLSGGAITDLTVNSGSVVNVTGSGTISNRSGAGNVNYNSVTIATELPLSGTTITSLNNVTVPTVTVSQNATVKVNNDSNIPAVNLVQVTGQGTLLADGGHLNTVTVNDSAFLIMNNINANVANAQLTDLSQLNVISGYVGVADLTGAAKATVLLGGEVGSLTVSETTGQIQVTIAGGTVGTATLAGDMIARIESGSVDSLYVSAQVNAIIIGGVIGPNTIRLSDDAVVDLYGTNLTLLPAGTGVDDYGSFARFILSGTLQNGDPLNNVNVLSYAGALAVGDPMLGAANPGSVRFFAVPEPGSIALLGTGLFLFTGMQLQQWRRTARVKMPS